LLGNNSFIASWYIAIAQIVTLVIQSLSGCVTPLHDFAAHGSTFRLALSLFGRLLGRRGLHAARAGEGGRDVVHEAAHLLAHKGVRAATKVEIEDDLVDADRLDPLYGVNDLLRRHRAASCRRTSPPRFKIETIRDISFDR
jgi:hypothetical protein